MECKDYEDSIAAASAPVVGLSLYDMARRLAKNVPDGQNFRRLMETFMNDVQCDALPIFQVV